MNLPDVVSREEWLAARKRLLASEKEFTRARDALNAERRPREIPERMRAAGFANYSRGHLGHSVGLAHHYEEPPFIAADEARPLAPGMVVSVELPYYLLGVGSFQMERIVLIEESGAEVLDRLPFELDPNPMSER